MKPKKSHVVKRLGLIKVLWTITFILLVMTFVTGLGKPILTSTIDKKLDELTDGQRNKSLYETWEQHKKDLAKIQGYDYKDPREDKRASILWSWKWGIGFVIFLFASFIYTGFVGFAEISSFVKQKIQARKKRGKKTGWAWMAFIIAAAFFSGVAVTLYSQYKAGQGILKLTEKIATEFVAAIKRIAKGVPT